MRSVTATVASSVARPDAPAFERRSGDGWTVWVDGTPTAAEAFAYSVARGLADHPRWLHCRYLYDETGSELFVRITEQPEYYPTRAESEILERYAGEIRALVGSAPLVELGAGAATKTRHLLDAWLAAADGDPVEYVPIDIDPSVLVDAAARLAEEFPDLAISGLATSYERGLDLLAHPAPLCLVFLGSTIGNFNPSETDAFLARLERSLDPGDALVLGVDLVKDVDVLEAAYNDAAGISEAFTRNLFARMNRELGTAIPVDAVDHVAYWNDRLERIEIYARFEREAVVELDSIGRSFRIAAGEAILTEISRKYRIARIEADLARFGFRLERSFTDEAGRFAVLVCRRIHGRARPPLRVRLAGQLRRMRLRTFDLVDALDDAQLREPALPILSPIAWDLGHMAEFEDLWLVRAIDRLAGDTREDEELDEIYDAIRTPREERDSIDLPDRDALLRRLADVRQRALTRLHDVELDDEPLLEDGFVYRMIAQHEAQHQETMLQAIAVMDDQPFEPAHRESPPRASLLPDAPMMIVPAGAFPAGTNRWPGAYDNERPTHWVELDAFWIDAAPVTNGEYLAFIDDGGYTRPELWSDEGRAWLDETACRHPMGWRRDESGGWVDEHFGHVEPLVPTRPVQHVSWFEADAYARWADKRLPTELEWEKAAAWDPELRIARRYPWGDEDPDSRRANLDARTYVPAPIGAYPDGRSFYGCHQMIGDVWEWTASEFGPYPGFEPFPYPEYSQAHFGRGHRVLRGGSWATASIVARTTFRNWDLPERRQIFAGLRCAKDA